MYANILYGKNTANFVVYKPSCCIFTSRHFAFELSVCFTCRHFAFELPLCFTCHHFAFELPLCFTCRHFAFELPLCFTCRYFAFELPLCFTCHYFVFELPVCFTSRQSIYILHRYRYLMNNWTFERWHFAFYKPAYYFTIMLMRLSCSWDAVMLHLKNVFC